MKLFSFRIMLRLKKGGILVALLLCSLSGLAPASGFGAGQGVPEGAPGQPSRKPFLTFGYDQRYRNEDWSNIQDQNSLTKDDIKKSIFRQRLWLNLSLGSPDVELYVRMLNQFVKTSTPSVPLNLDEVIFDNLYLNFKKTFIPGLSVKVGRQDLMFGEGFVLMDGSACEGPRTLYVNAIDIAYSFKKSKIDFLGILNPKRDRFLPVMHNQHKILNEPDEQAAGVYYADRNSKHTDWDLYYLLKKEIHDYRPTTSGAFQPDRHVNTMGGRIVHRFGRGFTATGELAFQKGQQNPDTHIHGWGGYGYLKKQFGHKWNPYVQGGYYALSGDDPSTAQYEGWDPLFGRWPKWSGMYPWSQVPEKGIGYWTNIKMIQSEAGFTPWKPVTIKGILYYDSAFHPYAKGDPSIFGRGKGRGIIPEVVASYAFGRSLVGEFRYEMLFPGKFYVGNSTGQFFRFEINYSFQHPFRKKGE